jgi:hypothetical protein
MLCERLAFPSTLRQERFIFATMSVGKAIIAGAR